MALFFLFGQSVKAELFQGPLLVEYECIQNNNYILVSIVGSGAGVSEVPTSARFLAMNIDGLSERNSALNQQHDFWNGDPQKAFVADARASVELKTNKSGKMEWLVSYNPYADDRSNWMKSSFVQQSEDLLYDPTKGTIKGRTSVYLPRDAETFSLDWQGQSFTCKKSHQLGEVKDLFPFDIKFESLPIPVLKERLRNENSLKSLRSFRFDNLTPRQYFDNFFPSLSIEDRREARPFCFSQGSAIAGCDDSQIYSSILWNNIALCKGKSCKVRFEIDPLGVGRTKVPVEVYAKALEKLQQRTFKLSLVVPKMASEEKLAKGAKYLSKFVGYDEALALLNSSKSSGVPVNIERFLTSHVRELVGHLDYPGQFSCHSFAYYLHNSADRNNQAARANGNYFFSSLSLSEPAQFGDVISLGNSHSAVYLARGYVLQKDDVGQQYPIRIVHLRDLARPRESPMGVYEYTDKRPTRIRRFVR